MKVQNCILKNATTIHFVWRVPIFVRLLVSLVDLLNNLVRVSSVSRVFVYSGSHIRVHYISLALERQSKQYRISVLNLVPVLCCHRYFSVTGTFLSPANRKTARPSRSRISRKTARPSLSCGLLLCGLAQYFFGVWPVLSIFFVFFDF